MIKLKNLAMDYLEYINDLNESSLDESETSWESYCYLKQKDIYDHIFDLYKQIDTSEDLHKAVFDVYSKEELKHKINRLSSCIEHTLQSVIEGFKENEIGELEDLSINIILVVGNGSTNAIVTPYEDGTLFLFLERLPEDKYLKILLAHELLHILQRKTLPYDNDEPMLKDILFYEGLACSVSEIINPGLTISEYTDFKLSSNIAKYNSFIIENIKTIEEDLLKRDWYTHKNYISQGEFQVERVGYYIGFSVVRKMMLERSVYDLMNDHVMNVRMLFNISFTSFINEIRSSGINI